MKLQTFLSLFICLYTFTNHTLLIIITLSIHKQHAKCVSCLFDFAFSLYVEIFVIFFYSFFFCFLFGFLCSIFSYDIFLCYNKCLIFVFFIINFLIFNFALTRFVIIYFHMTFFNNLEK